MEALDITGKKFGKLTALRFAYKGKRRDHYWLFRCDCGKETVAMKSAVMSGHTKSCGCLGGVLTHGLKRSRPYYIWTNMKTRCYNKNAKKYESYGGRGITVCDEWKNDFMAFYNWAIENGYNDGLTLDRIDNNGNYCPENCRWATPAEQSRNKRNNIFITYEGETLCLSDMARLHGVKRETAKKRLAAGKPLDKVFSKKGTK